jgi:hypothetical protein
MFKLGLYWCDTVRRCCIFGKVHAGAIEPLRSLFPRALLAVSSNKTKLRLDEDTVLPSTLRETCRTDDAVVRHTLCVQVEMAAGGTHCVVLLRKRPVGLYQDTTASPYLFRSNNL